MKPSSPLSTALLLPSLTIAQMVIPRACGAGNLSTARAAEIRSHFISSGIIGDIVPDFTPTTEFRVSYGSKAVDLGNSFGVLETLTEPTFSFDTEHKRNPANDKYLYMIVDPDAPSPELPFLRSFLHMITYDNPQPCIGGGSPKTLAVYLPFTPLSVSQHRYIYLLFRQPPGVFEPALDVLDQALRAPFDVQKFIDTNQIHLVGGNFMKEGLEDLLIGLVPGATQNGTGYSDPLNGTAEPLYGIGKLLSSLGL